jgi:hypothetical protein
MATGQRLLRRCGAPERTRQSSRRDCRKGRRSGATAPRESEERANARPRAGRAAAWHGKGSRSAPVPRTPRRLTATSSSSPCARTRARPTGRRRFPTSICSCWGGSAERRAEAAPSPDAASEARYARLATTGRRGPRRLARVTSTMPSARPLSASESEVGSGVPKRYLRIRPMPPSTSSVRFRGRARAHESCVTVPFTRKIVKLSLSARAAPRALRLLPHRANIGCPTTRSPFRVVRRMTEPACGRSCGRTSDRCGAWSRSWTRSSARESGCPACYASHTKSFPSRPMRAWGCARMWWD